MYLYTCMLVKDISQIIKENVSVPQFFFLF